MSMMTFSVLDARGAIHQQTHASFVHTLIPALSDDPETIEELAYAIRRFTPPDEEIRLADWPSGDCDEPFDAGLCVVDLAARLIVYQSTCCGLLRRGQVTFDDVAGGDERSARWIPFYISDDWLVTEQREDWRAQAERRRRERQARPPFDTREVLYGKVIEFIVDECFAARGGSTDEKGRWTPPEGWRWRELRHRAGCGEVSGGGEEAQRKRKGPYVDDAVAEIHARWLMTPRDDLRGQTPRGVLHARSSELSLHLQDRETQWTHFGQPPPPLWRESIAYRYGGYGVHEMIIYYYLVRHLIETCWDLVQTAPDQAAPDRAALIDRLGAAKQDWLHTPGKEELCDGPPIRVIECERLRIPLAVSGEEAMADPDCPLCQMMADSGPMFWHLDGCGMDDDFPFEVFCASPDEWEENRLDGDELDAGLDAEQEMRAVADPEDDPPRPDPDETEKPPSVWESSFSNPDADDSPELALFGLGGHLAELIQDLRRKEGSQEWIDTLNRDFGNLRESVGDPAGSLVAPVVSKFSEHLDAVAQLRSDLSPKCADLQQQLERFASRLRGESTTTDDDLRF